MMTTFPHFKAGQSWDDQSASEWNGFMDAMGKTFNDVVELKRKMALGDPGDLNAVRDAKVVITKAPIATDTQLTVRRVRYKDLPFKPCSTTACYLEFIGVEFLAFPEMGKQASDYAGSEYTGTADAISAGTTILNARLRDKQWIVEPKATGGTTSIVLVHGPFNGGSTWGFSQFVRVVHMKPSGSSYVTAESQAAGALGYSIVKVWPGTQESDWQWFQGTQGAAPNFTPTSTAVYLTTKMIGGVEYICPEVFAEAGAPDSGTVAGDC